jgi:sugar/nucleoside kinase (ribokinase family)
MNPFGEWLRNTIAAEGVEVSYLFRSRVARTTIAFVATRSDGRKDICFYRNPGADALLSAVDLRPAIFDNTQIFHCGSVTLSQSPAREAQLRAAKMAIERDVLVSFDPNWRPSIWSDTQEAHALIWEMIGLSDIVKVADEEWEFVTGTSDFEAGAAKIRAQGPRLVVITRGADGAYFNCASGRQTIAGEVPGFPVQAVDTLGAGDAFVAGLLWQVLQHRILNGLLNEAALQEIVRFANACGAIATQTAGAIPSLPTQAAIEQFLQTHAE